MATGTQLQKSAQATPGQPQLTDRIAGMWGRTRVYWAQMHPAQRGWTVVLILLLAGLIGGLFWYGLRTDWRTLYANMEPEDARQMGQVLVTAQIPFQPTPNGTGIMVPASQLDKARPEMLREPRLVQLRGGNYDSGSFGVGWNGICAVITCPIWRASSGSYFIQGAPILSSPYRRGLHQPRQQQNQHHPSSRAAPDHWPGKPRPPDIPAIRFVNWVDPASLRALLQLCSVAMISAFSGQESGNSGQRPAEIAIPNPCSLIS